MSEYGAHPSHCCSLHGCKYGQDELCPVATGKVLQKYSCEYCQSVSEIDAQIADLMTERLHSFALQVRFEQERNSNSDSLDDL